MDKPIPEAVRALADEMDHVAAADLANEPGSPEMRDALHEYASRLRAALTAAQQQGQSVAWRAEVERAIDRARVFDDGSDGADSESAQSVVAILTGLLNAQPTQQGGGDACPHCKGNPGLDCNSFGRTAPRSAPVGVEDDDGELVERVARAIATHGFGRPWDDFHELYVHDTDKSDLREYARAAIAALAQQPAAVDDAYRRGFVDGAKWWEWEKTGATMWQSDQQRAYDKATEKLATQHQEPKP